MQEVALGNLELLKELFERHHVHIYNFLYKMCGDKTLSEDIAQDVFYKVIKYRKSYNNGNFISWLFTIARNSLKTHFKRNRENHRDLQALQYKLAEEENGQSEDFSHLQRALAMLCTSDREILVLNRFQEVKYNEIAEITGSTPGAVKTKISRALKKLRVLYFEKI